MYENGGNTTHRILDGHPELFVYPFESQLGTRHVSDCWTSMYPAKYRWPEFLLSATLDQDYAAIIDEECKVRSRTPEVSKFRHWPFELDDNHRRDQFISSLTDVPLTRANLVCSFIYSTFEAWKDRVSSGKEHIYVGYSPVFGIDGERFLNDLPGGHLLHVIRNPWSAYADTKRRPVPLALNHYMNGWVSLQNAVLACQERFPNHVHVVRFEDLVEDPKHALTPFCTAIGIDPGELVAQPTWNGRPLDKVAPWGTIRNATPEENLNRAHELNTSEVADIERYARPLLSHFGLDLFLESTFSTR